MSEHRGNLVDLALKPENRTAKSVRKIMGGGERRRGQPIAKANGVNEPSRPWRQREGSVDQSTLLQKPGDLESIQRWRELTLKVAF